MMNSVTDLRQSTMFSLYLLLTLFATINCQILNISNSDDIISAIKITKVLEELQKINVIKLPIQSTRQSSSINNSQVSVNDTNCMRQINSLYVGITNMEQWALGSILFPYKIILIYQLYLFYSQIKV